MKRTKNQFHQCEHFKGIMSCSKQDLSLALEFFLEVNCIHILNLALHLPQLLIKSLEFKKGS